MSSTNDTLSNLLNHLFPGARILDIGCGTGRHAIELAGRGFSVWAVDMDGDAVETARELSETQATLPSFAVARGEALPFRDGAFDAVSCLDVLHWAPDQAVFDALWSEVLRVLGAGGLLVARLRCRDAFPDALSVGGGRFRLASGAEWFLPSREDLLARLKRSGADPVGSPEADSEGRALVVARLH